MNDKMARRVVYVSIICVCTMVSHTTVGFGQESYEPRLLFDQLKRTRGQNLNLFTNMLRSDDRDTRKALIELARRRPRTEYKQFIEEHLRSEQDPELKLLCETVIAEMRTALTPQVSANEIATQFPKQKGDALYDYSILNFAGVEIDSVPMARLPEQVELRFLLLPDGVTNEDAEAVGQCHSLQTLFLSKAKVTDSGVAKLCELQDLEVLDLTQCRFVTGDCLDALVKLPKLKKLYLPPSIAKSSITKLHSFDHLEILLLVGDLPINVLQPLGELKSIKAITLLNIKLSENELNSLRTNYPKILWVSHEQKLSHQ